MIRRVSNLIEIKSSKGWTGIGIGKGAVHIDKIHGIHHLGVSMSSDSPVGVAKNYG